MKSVYPGTAGVTEDLGCVQDVTDKCWQDVVDRCNVI